MMGSSRKASSSSSSSPSLATREKLNSQTPFTVFRVWIFCQNPKKHLSLWTHLPLLIRGTRHLSFLSRRKKTKTKKKKKVTFARVVVVVVVVDAIITTIMSFVFDDIVEKRRTTRRNEYYDVDTQHDWGTPSSSSCLPKMFPQTKSVICTRVESDETKRE